jgi:hypothetical protein
MRRGCGLAQRRGEAGRPQGFGHGAVSRPKTAGIGDQRGAGDIRASESIEMLSPETTRCFAPARRDR